MSVILRAAQFAHRAHAGQFRKGPEQVPYFTHLARVAGRVASMPAATPEMVAAAFLHDVLEDTEVTTLELFNEFPRPIPEYVCYLTDIPPTPGMNRAKRKAKDFEFLQQAPAQVKIIRLCDAIDNMYGLEVLKPEFRPLFIAEIAQCLQVVAGTDKTLEDELEFLISQAKKATKLRDRLT